MPKVNQNKTQSEHYRFLHYLEGGSYEDNERVTKRVNRILNQTKYYLSLLKGYYLFHKIENRFPSYVDFQTFFMRTLAETKSDRQKFYLQLQHYEKVLDGFITGFNDLTRELSNSYEKLNLDQITERLNNSYKKLEVLSVGQKSIRKNN